MVKRLLIGLSFLFCQALVTTVLAQDDIEITDSTSTDWGGGGGGGLNPGEPNEPVTSMTISRTTLTLAGGQSERLVVTFNAQARDKRVIWTVANSAIAVISPNGVVMGMGKGTTTVTATSVDNSNFTATCTITVTSDYVLKEAGWILKKGTEEPWQMKYIFYPNRDEYVEPANDSSGRTWHDLGYDDSQWQTLTGPMNSDGSGNFYWEGYENSFCLRREVFFPKSGGGTLKFFIKNDDSILFWLNGRLVVDHHDWSVGEYLEYEISAADYVQGINLLSVYITQGGGDACLDYGIWYEPSILGDVNNDGYVTMADAVCIVNYIMGNPSPDYNEDAADVNQDGKVTVSDAAGVVNIIVNSGGSAPQLELKDSETGLE